MMLRPYNFLKPISLAKNFKNVRNTQKIIVVHYSTTIDAAEIKHFKNYHEEWWNETGKFRPLHAMNSIRLPFIKNGLENAGVISQELSDGPKPLANLDILDIGCGGGILTEALARIGAKVTGIDACKELVDCAKLHALEDPEIKDSIKYVCETAEEHSKQENHNKYDAVVASEIVEHVNNQELFLESCCNVLKPGGSIFITTMNKTTLAWLGAIIMAEDVIGLVPKGTHDWDKFISPNEVQRLLEKYNCRTRCIHGMTYNILTHNWLWFPDTSINYALHAIKYKKS